MRIFSLCFMLIICKLSFTNGFFGKKDKEEDKKIGAKDSVALGIDMMMQASGNPAQLKEAMAMLNDPATRKEVESMMADPAFRKEMEKMKSNPVYMNAIQGAKDMLDPQRAANIQSQMAAHKEDELSDAALGLQEMMKASKNPKMLADAMEMMKDPEIAAEVQAMMKDPKFQAEMKRYTSSPAYKTAMSRAAEDIENLSKDPARLKKLEVDFAEKMRG